MNGVGELHSTTLEVTMDSFFSGVQLHFTIDQRLHVHHAGQREMLRRPGRRRPGRGRSRTGASEPRAGALCNQKLLLHLRRRGCRQRHENRADKWAVTALIPVDALDDAVADGCTEVWELAERFQVTEEFVRKAVCWYVHGNMAAELYF